MSAYPEIFRLRQTFEHPHQPLIRTAPHLHEPLVDAPLVVHAAHRDLVPGVVGTAVRVELPFRQVVEQN